MNKILWLTLIILSCSCGKNKRIVDLSNSNESPIHDWFKSLRYSHDRKNFELNSDDEEGLFLFFDQRDQLIVKIRIDELLPSFHSQYMKRSFAYQCSASPQYCLTECTFKYDKVSLQKRSIPTEKILSDLVKFKINGVEFAEISNLDLQYEPPFLSIRIDPSMQELQHQSKRNNLSIGFRKKDEFVPREIGFAGFQYACPVKNLDHIPPHYLGRSFVNSSKYFKLHIELQRHTQF